MACTCTERGNAEISNEGIDQTANVNMEDS